jgi:hypothetical protein
MVVLGPSTGHPKGIRHSVLSRCVEKGALYATLMMEMVLDKLLADKIMDNVSRVILWSDCGPGFRCTRFVACAAARWVHRYSRAFTLRYGLEHHFKSCCDTEFSLIHRTIASAEKKLYLCSSTDLQEVLSESHNNMMSASGAPHYFHDFVPPVSREEWDKTCPLVRPSSLPLPIKSTHEFVFVPADCRRTSFVGRDGTTLTGVHARATRLPGFRASILTTNFLKLASQEEKDEVAAVEPDITDETTKGSEIGEQVQFYQGWRTTYRTGAPESAVLPPTMRRLTTKRAVFGDMPLPPASRHMQRR